MRYNDEDWVLKGISFKVEVGQKVAFVGHTGVGKSTIINLISGIIKFKKGQILVDGVPIEDWKLRICGKAFSTVMQDVFLFSGRYCGKSGYACQSAGGYMEKALEIVRGCRFC